MSLTVKAKIACEIAGINPARFNEMIHAGQYTCAPETKPGSARIFNLDQIVALKIFGNLLSMAVVPERAGHIACNAYSLFAGRDDDVSVIYSIRRNGDRMMVLEIHGDNNPLPEFCMVFDIPGLRKEIIRHLESQNQAVSEE